MICMTISRCRGRVSNSSSMICCHVPSVSANASTDGSAAAASDTAVLERGVHHLEECLRAQHADAAARLCRRAVLHELAK